MTYFFVIGSNLLGEKMNRFFKAFSTILLTCGSVLLLSGCVSSYNNTNYDEMQIHLNYSKVFHINHANTTELVYVNARDLSGTNKSVLIKNFMEKLVSENTSYIITNDPNDATIMLYITASSTDNQSQTGHGGEIIGGLTGVTAGAIISGTNNNYHDNWLPLALGVFGAGVGWLANNAVSLDTLYISVDVEVNQQNVSTGQWDRFNTVISGSATQKNMDYQVAEQEIVWNISKGIVELLK